MKKFLLLLVGVLFALSAKADYYLVGDAVGDWSSKSYKFTETSTTGVFELEINGKVKAGDFKINGGGNDWTTANIGATGGQKVTVSFGTIYDYQNNSSSSNFNFPSEQSYALFVLNTNTSKLTVYNSKPLEAHVPSGYYCFFLNTEDWTTPHTYVWKDGSNNSWPGKAMSQYMSQYNGTRLYLWEDASLSFSPSNVKFNNGSDAKKTKDLTFTNGAVYNPDGSLQSTFSNTYYFDIAGSAITTTPTLSIGWATVLGVQTGKSGVYKFDLTTSIPTNYWEVSFTDGTNTYDSPLIVADNVYKVEGTEVVNKGEYSKYGASATNYTIYFDAAGTAWDGVTLTYADGQPTVTGAAVEGKAGVYSFSFESTLTEAQMSVEVANSDKSFSCATFTNDHIYKLYRGALKDGGEYTAEYAVTTPVETTIYFTTEGTDWTGVKIHYWDNFNNDLTGAWGRTAMTKVKGTDNVWKYTIPANHMNVLCGIIFTDGYTGDKHQTVTLYTDDVKAGHLYKINTTNWTVASQGLYTEPTTTYYYRLHGSIFTNGVKEDGGWYTQDCMTDNHDGTYSFTATIKAGSFGIKRLTSDKVGDINGNNPWINSPSSVTMVADTEYPAQVKNNNGADFYTELSGKYTIVFNPTTMKVKIVSSTVTPKNYVWRLHTDIITGSWPAADNTLADYAMTKQTDGVTWVWEGRVSNSGFFGFKRLNEGDKPSNYTPWFYCNSNSDYTVALNTASTGKLKANNSDASGHDWKWNLTPGRYRISLNATNPDAPVITITALDSDYSGLVYVIAGTFNGWTAPDTYLNLDKENQPFTFTYDEGTKKYVWRYTGTMKNVSFKISNMTDADTDNDPHWGKAFGYSYNGTKVADLTPGTEYQLRRTNVPGEDVFIKFQDNDNNLLTLVNPTFTLDPSNMTLVVKNNPVEEPENTFYWIKGDFGTDSESWELKAMSPVGDGTWTWQGHFNKAAAGFGVMKSKSSTDNTQTGWLNSVSADGNDVVAKPGVVYTCYWGGSVPEGTTCKNWTSSGLQTDVEYRFVFNPTATPAPTLIIYSLAPVKAYYEALESSSDAGKALGQAVNNLYVELKPSEYLPVEATDSYSLQIGGKVIANGVSVGEGLYRFDFLPYFVNDQELTLVASESKSADIVVKSAGKIDINASVGTVWFEGSKYDNAWYATIKVPYTTSVNAVYNYPHVTYTRTDQEGSFEADVIWTEGGFTIEVPDAIEVNSDGLYKGGEITFNFKFTPVIPFAVYTAPVASSASLNAPAADATNLTLQMFGGTLNTYPLTITATTGIDVSGVEGVAVENEEAPVEYYNLQGQRVNGELAPGIYIRRQGTTVTKVRI